MLRTEEEFEALEQLLQQAYENYMNRVNETPAGIHAVSVRLQSEQKIESPRKSSGPAIAA
jgi:hypothetical protein